MPAIAFADLFDEIVALLLVATLAGVFAVRLRQPLIIGFIVVGILAGPSFLNWIRSAEEIHTMAEMGLALLLFVVGLKLDVKLIRNMGRVALAAGLGQVTITTLGGFGMSYALGMNPVESFYVALALAFSSTIIIVKLLSDKGEADSLHGRLALGILIVQDVVVVLAMIVLSSFSARGDSQPPLFLVALVVARGLGLLAAVWLATAYVLPRMLPLLGKASELLVLFGIAWALGLANLGEALGFSKEIGAFLAGVSLASTPFRETIGAKLTSLRDFLLVFFFIELGGRLDLGLMGSQVWSAIPLSLFVLIGNPIIVMAIAGALGYRKRTGLLTGITIAQVSEFSLILVAMGAKLGHIGDAAVGVVTLTGMATIGISTYLISYSQDIYERLSPYIGIFERKGPHREDSCEAALGSESADTVVFGLGSYGRGIAEHLESRGRTVLGVDFDPQAVLRWKERGRDAVFGDARDTEVAEALHLGHVRWVVSSIRDEQVNASLLRSLRQVRYSGYTAIVAYDQSGEELIGGSRPDLALNPFSDAAVQAADLIFSAEEQIARRAMDKLIESMSGHYIVCGYGRMGQQIVKDLTHHSVPCVVVESNPEQLPKLREGGIAHVEGNASEDNVLVSAGIKRAKGLIAVAASDESNVFIVLTARVLNPELFIVARSILEENEDKLRHAGADMVMSPYVLGGRRMAAAVIKPEVMDFLDLVVHSDGSEVEMAKLNVHSGSGCIGKSLREINPWETCGVTLLAIRRQGEDLHANPSPDLPIAEGDELIVMGTPSQIEAVKQWLEFAGG